MDSLRKKCVLWLSLGIFSVISATVGTVLLALAALDGLYFAVAILIVVVAHGFYGIPFYFTALMRTRADISTLSEYEAGNTTPKGVAEATGLTESAARDSISRLRKGKLIQ